MIKVKIKIDFGSGHEETRFSSFLDGKAPAKLVTIYDEHNNVLEFIKDCYIGNLTMKVDVYERLKEVV